MKYDSTNILPICEASIQNHHQHITNLLLMLLHSLVEHKFNIDSRSGLFTD